MPRTCECLVLLAVLAIVLAGCGSTSSPTTVHSNQATRTASPSVAPADVVRDLFATEKAHEFTAYCAMLTPAARVAYRENKHQPLHEIGDSCEQKLTNEIAESNLTLSRGYTSLRTTSETSDTAVVEVKNEKEGVTGSERSYAVELERCGASWLWPGWASYSDSNSLAKNLYESLVRHYGCEPEAEVIKRRGLVIVSEESSSESSGASTGSAEG